MLTEAEFAFVSREVKTRSGALITRDLGAQAEQRLLPIARREGFGTVSEFLHAARTRQDGKLLAPLADALAQSDTRFFRDKNAFERLRNEILPEIRARKDRIRIWSAGCATGQEAFSLAIMLDEMKAEGFTGAEIIATDMSERLLDKARSGLFTQFEVQRGLAIRRLIAHFERAGDLWRISDRMRASVRFEQHNLLQHAGALGSFDVVLCCNVMSAFDPATRAVTLARIADVTAPGGTLILGASESAADVEGMASAANVARKAA